MGNFGSGPKNPGGFVKNGGTPVPQTLPHPINNVNNSAPIGNTIDEQVQQVLKGQRTSQPNRADNPDVSCPDVAPGFTAPTNSQKALVVTVSPNSPGSLSTTITEPVGQVLISDTIPQVLAQANLNRSEMIIQNTGTTVIYLIFGIAPGGPANATQGIRYHVALAPGAAAHDGTGATWVSDLWKGQVSAFAAVGGGQLAISEFTP
jgi:hypothetical protein